MQPCCSCSMELSKQFQKLSVTSHKRRIKNKKYNEEYFPSAVKVKVYSNRSPDRDYWLKHPNQQELKWSIDLIPKTKQFNAVVDPIKNSIGSSIKICNVYKIANKYLERQYELKKDLKETYATCEEYRMYHFTVQENLSSIITNNFNWRLSGLSRGHLYGRGISFSPNPKWAEQFCKSKMIKILLVVKVLISSSQVGEKGMVLPDDGFDTTASPKKTVFVKFEDSEFYPEYLVYYYK